MNLAGFRKKAEDKKMVTMVHPSGHEIRIAKSAVSPLQRKQLERLPMMADGGDPGVAANAISDFVDKDQGQSIPDGTPTSSSDNSNGQTAFQRDIGKLSDFNADAASKIAGIPELGGASAPAVTSDEISNIKPNEPIASNSPLMSTASISSSSGDDESNPTTPAASTKEVGPSENTATGLDVNKSYNQGQRAIDEQQKVASDIANAQAQQQATDIVARQTLAENVANNAQTFQEHQKAFLDDYANGHIKPNAYVENMSTPQKVATAIGLLIGGFTGGFNKTGVNPAQVWLNGQIDRDIAAQKANQDQKMTVFGANQNLYHDQLLADNATRINMNDLYDHQIQHAATLQGTAAAKAAADAQHSQFALQNAKLIQDSAIRSGALQQIKNSSGIGLDPVTLSKAQLMTPEEGQKEQAAFDKQKQTIDSIHNIYSQLNKEQTSGNIGNVESARRVAGLYAQLAPLVQSEDPSKRLTPDVYEKLIQPFHINLSDNAATRISKQQSILDLAKQANAGQLPNLSRISPKAVPQFTAIGNQASAAPQHRPGDIVYTKSGQKGQVLANGQIRAVTNGG